MTIRQKLQRKVASKASLDSLDFTRKIDSLRHLKLSTRKYRKKLDSLQNKKSQLVEEVNQKQNELQQKITGRYNKWTKGFRDRFKLDSLGIKLPGSGLANDLPAVREPGAGFPANDLVIPGIPDFGLADLPEIPTLNSNDFSNLGLSNDLMKAGEDISIPSVDQLAQWDKGIPSLEQYNAQLNQYTLILKDPSKAAESAVSQFGAVKEVNQQLAAAEKLRNENQALQIAKKMQDAESMKGEARKLATQEAVNHFAGQEKTLQQTMDRMSKYKKKYSSLNSLSEIKKNEWLPRNGLKGKPFRERFRPGLHVGVRSASDTINVDFYPNASYRITGRLEVGAGAIYRVSTSKTLGFDQRNPVWGLAGFTIFKPFKSTYLRVEADANNYPIKTGDETMIRQWRWSFLAGVQTNFRISKTVTGNIQVLFNFDKNIKDVFPEALTMRFGVQYRLK